MRSAFINHFRKAEYVKSGKVFASSSMIFLWLKEAQIFCQCLKHEGTHILQRFYASQDIPILSDGLAKLHQELDKEKLPKAYIDSQSTKYLTDSK